MANRSNAKILNRGSQTGAYTSNFQRAKILPGNSGVFRADWSLFRPFSMEYSQRITLVDLQECLWGSIGGGDLTHQIGLLALLQKF